MVRVLNLNVTHTMQILFLTVQLFKDLMDWVSRRLATWLATQTGLCLGPRFIVSPEGLGLWEMEFAHMFTPTEKCATAGI